MRENIKVTFTILGEYFATLEVNFTAFSKEYVCKKLVKFAFNVGKFTLK